MNIQAPLLILLLTACAAASGGESPPAPLIRCQAELDRGVLPADQTQTAIVKISLAAAPPPPNANRSPVNLCLVLDRSGSMGGSKLENAKEAAMEALSRLGRNDVVSVVAYNSSVETLFPAQPLTDVAQVRNLIQGIHSSGNTALFGGVSQAAAELRKHSEDQPKGMVHRMVLLSDGLANVGPSSPGDLSRLGAGLVKEGISVSTVGLGDDYNEDVMTGLSRRSDGNTYFAENSLDLPRIFTEELGDVLNVVARDARLVIECGEGVKPVRTIGRDADIRGRRVVLDLNQLYGNQERYLLLEVEVPAFPDQSEIPLATARVRYHDVFQQTAGQHSASLWARFSSQEEAVSASVNPRVQQDYYFNQSAMAKEEAIRQWEAGDTQGARRTLTTNSLLLQQASTQYDLPELNREAENLRQKEQELETLGLTKRNRKALKTEALQESQQQRIKRHRSSSP